MRDNYGGIRLFLRTLRGILRRRSDSERWGDLLNHDPEWDDRTQALAALIPPGSRVVEFGSGRRQLERWLPPACTYIPTDIVERGPGSLIVDLNRRPLPDLEQLAPDAVAFSGVVEYVLDVPAVVRWLADHASVCVLSYNCAKAGLAATGRAREVKNRLAAGWVNHYSDAELTGVFEAAGYRLGQRMPSPLVEGNEWLYAFRASHLRPRGF